MRIAAALAVMVVSASVHADPCDVLPAPRTLHKVRIISTEIERDKEVATLRGEASEVIVDYGQGLPIIVVANDRQLEAIRKRHFVADIDDAMDIAVIGSVAIDTGERGKLEPPRTVPGWELAARGAVPYVVHLRAPPYTSDWFHAFEVRIDAKGLQANNTFEGNLDIKMTEAQAAWVSQQPEVQWVGRLEPLYKVSTELAGVACPALPRPKITSLTAAATGKGVVDLDITLFENTPAVRATIKTSGAQIEWDNDTLLQLRAPRSAIRLLATRPEVALITMHHEPSLN
jgi:hypothetical protein